MTDILQPDLCVIGGGPGAVAAACAAARLGGKVVFVEKRALAAIEQLHGAWQIQTLASLAARVTALRGAVRPGVAEAEARVDFKRMRRENDAAIHQFLRDESPERLAALNIKIVQAPGVFTGASRFEAGDFAIEARRFLLAIGSTPVPPPVAGLELVRPLTADRMAELATVPKKLIVIGADHESLVLAQAFLRLGSRVSLLQPGAFLPQEDPELTAPLRIALRREGMEILENIDITGIELPGSGLQSAGLRVRLGTGEAVEASHLFYATHRAALVEGLGLKAARVAYDKDGVTCNADRRSSNPKIYAINDGFDSFQSIARSRREAEWVVDRLFSRAPPPMLQSARIIGTDPEIACIGLSEAAARAKHRSIGVLRAGFYDNLRYQTAVARPRYSAGVQALTGQAATGQATTGQAVGHVKIITDSHGRLIGAGIVGPQARELIGIFSLALAKRLEAADLASLAADEPTLMEICRNAALASAPQNGKVAGKRRFPVWRSMR